MFFSLTVVGIWAVVARTLFGLQWSDSLFLILIMFPAIAVIFTVLSILINARSEVKNNKRVTTVDTIIFILLYLILFAYFTFMPEIRFTDFFPDYSIATNALGVSVEASRLIANELATAFIFLSLFGLVVFLIELIISKKRYSKSKLPSKG
jgi:hypothetical protein